MGFRYAEYETVVHFNQSKVVVKYHELIEVRYIKHKILAQWSKDKTFTHQAQGP